MPNSQLQAIIEGTASLSQWQKLCFISFKLECHQDPGYKIGSLNLQKRLVWFEPKSL